LLELLLAWRKSDLLVAQLFDNVASILSVHHSASSLLQILPVFPATPRPTKFLVRFGTAADPVLLPQMQRCFILGTTFCSSWFCVGPSSHLVAYKSVRIFTTPTTIG